MACSSRPACTPAWLAWCGVRNSRRARLRHGLAPRTAGQPRLLPDAPVGDAGVLAEVLPRALGGQHICMAWDPACGEGHMVEVLQEEIAIVRGSDIFDYGLGYSVADFLDRDTRMLPRSI